MHGICTLEPMGPVPRTGDTRPMITLAIRCHPSVPVDADDLEEWLEHQADKLRAKAPHATVRLARLTQHLPGTEGDIGWLLELELAHSDQVATEAQLDEALTDMRLLGFQPTVLTPRVASDRASSGHFANAWSW